MDFFAILGANNEISTFLLKSTIFLIFLRFSIWLGSRSVRESALRDQAKNTKTGHDTDFGGPPRVLPIFAHFPVLGRIFVKTFFKKIFWICY